MDQTSFIQLNKPSVSGTDLVTDDKFWKENPDKIDAKLLDHTNKIGDLTTLTTTSKTDLVSAINNNVSSLAQMMSQNNNTITYGYDSNGNVQTVTEKDPSNNVIKTVTYTYNAVGDVATSVTIMNGKTVTTTYNYDANANITSTSNVIS